MDTHGGEDGEPGAASPAALTVGAYLDQWLQLHRTQVEASTWHSYAAISRRYLAPALGDIVLDELSRDAVSAAYDRLARSGGNDGGPLSLRTVQYCHSVLHKAVGDAVRLGLLADNPCTRALVPRHHPSPPPDREVANVWSAEQLLAFLAATAGEPHAEIWAVAAGTGMRRGELLALSWDDVDLDGRSLRVAWALSVVGGRVERKTPKTARTRNLTFDTSVADALARQRRRQDGWQQGSAAPWGNAWNLVFTHPDGRPLLPDVVSRSFRRQVDRLDLPRASLHTLRHVHATLCLQAGVPVKVLSERLGHSTIRITLDIYAHVLPTMDAEAVHAFSVLLDEAEGFAPPAPR